MGLDLHGDVVALAGALVDIPSESRHERQIADEVERALSSCPHLSVERVGNTIVARTHQDHQERVLIGGHLDTVPGSANMPHYLADGRLFGLGACDMKGGVAVALHTAATVIEPTRDVTYVFYECEEIDAASNGLQLLLDSNAHLLHAELAILMEPSNALIEAGCQGTLRAEVHIPGKRAHSARAWRGENAIHRAADLLGKLRDFEPRQPVIDGLQFREGLNAVGVAGGVAGNVIPDSCVITVNYRFAPDRSVDEAIAFVSDFFDGYQVRIVDSAPAAHPGLSNELATAFAGIVGGVPAPKLGWTDVARFTALGVPALNFGPGDPALAHAADESVPIAQIERCSEVLRTWLMTP